MAWWEPPVYQTSLLTAFELPGFLVSFSALPCYISFGHFARGFFLLSSPRFVPSVPSIIK